MNIMNLFIHFTLDLGEFVVHESKLKCHFYYLVKWKRSTKKLCLKLVLTINPRLFIQVGISKFILVIF